MKGSLKKTVVWGLVLTLPVVFSLFIGCAKKQQGNVAVYWRGKTDNYSPDRKKAVKVTVTGAKQGVSIPLGVNNVESLRLDLPGLPGKVAEVGSFAVKTRTGGEALDVNMALGLHDMKRGEGNTFFITGKAPYMRFILPAQLYSEEIVSAEVQFSIHREPLFGSIKNLVSKPREAPRVETMEVFWRGGNEKFSPEMRVTVPVAVSGQTQTVSFPLSVRDVELLRLDLPSAQGIATEIKSFTVRTGNGTVSLDTNAIIGLHDLESGDGRTFYSTDKDPYIVFELPKPFTKEEIVSVEAVFAAKQGGKK